jgi:uncharacterized membrane protein YciS (DUF1049 family)
MKRQSFKLKLIFLLFFSGIGIGSLIASVYWPVKLSVERESQTNETIETNYSNSDHEEVMKKIDILIMEADKKIKEACKEMPNMRVCWRSI